jgi:hypothetical protein
MVSNCFNFKIAKAFSYCKKSRLVLQNRGRIHNTIFFVTYELEQC